MKKNDIFNIALLYEQLSFQDENYYNSLNNYLKQFNLHLGENLFNPDLPYNNPNQKGIYKGKKQIGKIERIIKPDVLILEHIKSYYEGQGLVKIIYPHDLKYASDHNLNVESEAVNNYTYNEFLKYFRDWKITKSGTHNLLAEQP